MNPKKNLPEPAFPASKILRVILVDTYSAEQLREWDGAGEPPAPAYPGSRTSKVIPVDTYSIEQLYEFAAGGDSPSSAVGSTASWVSDVIRDVAELPDRDSPKENPDMMLVTADELTDILLARAGAAALDGTRGTTIAQRADMMPDGADPTEYWRKQAAESAARVLVLKRQLSAAQLRQAAAECDGLTLDQLQTRAAEFKCAVVPLHLSKAMRRVIDDEVWQWEDLLAAAEAITEDQYAEIAATSDSDSGEPELIQALETGAHSSSRWFGIHASDIASHIEDGYKVRKLYTLKQAVFALQKSAPGTLKLVPLHPTLDMVSAAWRHGNEKTSEAPDPVYAYKAMLMAAPDIDIAD